MDYSLNWVKNPFLRQSDEDLGLMSVEEIERAIHFHQSFPQYKLTPLAQLKNMSEMLGLSRIYIKDESYRFNLNAFKVLGGSYAIGRYIAERVGKSIEEADYNYLTSKQLIEDFGVTTFFSATDGNHGRGIAWAANKLGQKAVIRMPKGTTDIRLKNIRAEYAEVTIEDLNYDQCVELANRQAKAVENGVMVQDTAWAGYEKIPTWIMQGYGTMAFEADLQVQLHHPTGPTHVFIQAGVGSLAGAIVGYFSNKYNDNIPKFVVVEPDVADCHYQTALAGTGKIVNVGGDMQTIMAGLACGEPNTISWPLLKNHVDYFVSINDAVAERGMRLLGAPLKGDPQVISGESGAAPFGALATMMLDDKYSDLREALELNENARVLLFSTEGDTDPIRYKEILWEGKHYNL